LVGEQAAEREDGELKKAWISSADLPFVSGRRKVENKTPAMQKPL